MEQPTPMSIRFPPELDEKITQLARTTGESKATIIRQAVRAGLTKDEQPEPQAKPAGHE